MKRFVMILGGYGALGSRICAALVDANIPIIIAGRRKKPALQLLNTLRQTHPHANIKTQSFDLEKDLSSELKLSNPNILINTCGPFQTKNLKIPKFCIQHKIHYIDLADDRSYVKQFLTLNTAARSAQIHLITTASTSSGLFSAVIEHYQNRFKSIHQITCGVTLGQKTQRGLATAESVLSYLGKPIKAMPTLNQRYYGWQNLYRQNYPILGKRWMGTCAIPDLDLFPTHYGIQNIHFSAGMENTLLHLSLWLLSWLVRANIPLSLAKHAKLLLKLSNCLNCFGSKNGGAHLILQGKDSQGNAKTIKWFIVGLQGDGLQIPSTPAVILTKKILNQTLPLKAYGATPCIGLVTLEEYLNELSRFHIKTFEQLF